MPSSDAAPIQAYYRRVAPFIDHELEDRSDLPFWRRRAQEDAGPVLELGCGTGRVTAALAGTRRGITALDLSPDMLVRARRRLGHRHGVRLLRADMRALPLRGPYALVAAADDPFTHLLEDHDREQALAEVARVLKPGGRFVLEAFRMAPSRLEAASTPKGWRRERPLAGGPADRVRETWRCDRETLRCRARYEYFHRGRRLVEARFTCRLWREGELDARLVEAGLLATHRWTSWDGRGPATDGEVLVVEARRPPSPPHDRRERE